MNYIFPKLLRKIFNFSPQPFSPLILGFAPMFPFKVLNTQFTLLTVSMDIMMYGISTEYSELINHKHVFPCDNYLAERWPGWAAITKMFFFLSIKSLKIFGSHIFLGNSNIFSCFASDDRKVLFETGTGYRIFPIIRQ